MKIILALVAFLVASLAWSQTFDQSVGTFTPPIDRTKVRIDQRLGFSIPAQDEFLDQHGRAVRLADFLHSKPLLVLPIFFRCVGVCRLEVQSLTAALPKMKLRVGRDFDLVVVSIDPQEGPTDAMTKFQATLNSAPALRGTDSGWHFLSGKLDNIRALTDALGFHYTYDATKDLINHPSGLMIVTPGGTISSYVLGADYNPDLLTRDLDLAIRSKVGEKAPDVFFGCIHIDPLTGKRSIVIEGVLRLAAIATVLGIIGGVGILSIGRARRKARGVL